MSVKRDWYDLRQRVPRATKRSDTGLIEPHPKLKGQIKVPEDEPKVVSTISRALSVLFQDGFKTLIKKVVRRTSHKLMYFYFFIQGFKQVEMVGSRVSVRISDAGSYTETTFFEQNEKDELADLVAEVGTNDIFYDVGANIGLYSLFADEYAKDVYAIEPHPTNASRLLDNSQLNQSDIHVVLCAVSDQNGYSGLDGSRDGTEVDGKVALSDEAHSVLVRSETGDSLLSHLPPPDIVKIDVEGAELAVLKGLSETFATTPPRVVYCEVHENRDVSRKRVVSQFKDMNYSTEVFEDYGSRVMLKAKHETADIV